MNIIDYMISKGIINTDEQLLILGASGMETFVTFDVEHLHPIFRYIDEIVEVRRTALKLYERMAIQ